MKFIVDSYDEIPSERNNTGYEEDQTLPSQFSKAANLYVDKIAIRFIEKETAGSFSGNAGYEHFRGTSRLLSYSDLSASVNQFANLLLDKGVKPGTLVGVAVTRSPSLVIALLAILKAGAAYLPIDPDYPAERIAFMLSDSSAEFLILSRANMGELRTRATEIIIEEAWDQLKGYSAEAPAVRVEGSDLAYLLYTSGSTGNPKGVQIEHHSLINFLVSMQRSPGMEAKDRLLAVTTISFDIAGLELFLPFLCGAELVLTNKDTVKDGRLLLEIIRHEEISIMQATPSTWRMIVDAGWDNPFPLKVLCGGEALPAELADRLIRRSDSVWNMYGPTETTIWSSIRELSTEGEVITIGRPIARTQIYLLDPAMKQVLPGSVGEIYIGGEGVARGYLNRPDLTRERFIEDPFQGGKNRKMYRTGDTGRMLENGEIQFLGRMDHQVKIRGYRIELGEIEQVLTRLKGIRQAVVTGKNGQLVAYLVQDRTVTKDPVPEWKRQLKEILPEYMLPNHFVLLEAFPLTPNGKTDRNALPEPNAGGSIPALIGEPPSPVETTLAHSSTEHLLTELWQEFLNQEKIGMQDDFFELGGNSLNALQIMVGLEKRTGMRLPLSSLFGAPTIKKLAELVNSGGRSVSWAPLVPIKPGGTKAPVYIVHGYGMNVLTFNRMARYLDPEQPVYGFQAKGLNGVDEPFDRMEDIAADYIREMLSHHNADSYNLAGYSFGGIVAFEMARQLKEMGKKITMLGMIDTYADKADYFEKGPGRLLKKIRRQLPKIRFVITSFKKYPGPTLAYQLAFFQRKIREGLYLFGGKPPVTESTQEDKIDEKYEAAYRNYKMIPYDGVIDLFRVKTRLYYLDDLVYMGWKKYSREVEIHEISGDHKTFLLPPNDREFAGVLQKTLDGKTALTPIRQSK
ncbi:non-ribosomal peptide synthetase [Flavitalea flava]